MNMCKIDQEYRKEINFIATEVDFVPDSRSEYEKWPEPWRSQALEALAYRKTMFDALCDTRLSEWE